VRPDTLSRYLLGQNLFYLLTSLAAGTAVYLLSDIFDRLDDFLEAGVGLGTMGLYFLVKIPLVISQIMPAVFLISLLVQLSIMARSRELTALRAGGIPPGRLAAFFLAYALAWSVLQLGFSQLVGVWGEQAAGRIWAEEVREKSLEKTELANVWFKEGDLVVEMAQVWPARQAAGGVSLIRTSPAGDAVLEIIAAERAEAVPGRWVLYDVRVLSPAGFASRTSDRLVLPLTHDVRTFLAIDPDVEPSSLPMWQLSGLIERLRATGSNVERLRTAWHMKWSYSFSILAVALAGLALFTFVENLYANIAASLGLTFVFYTLFMLGSAAAQKGLLPPIVGAWLGNGILGTLAAARLVAVGGPRGPA